LIYWAGGLKSVPYWRLYTTLDGACFFPWIATGICLFLSPIFPVLTFDHLGGHDDTSDLLRYPWKEGRIHYIHTYYIPISLESVCISLIHRNAKDTPLSFSLFDLLRILLFLPHCISKFSALQAPRALN
jgi:hypothetical protein